LIRCSVCGVLFDPAVDRRARRLGGALEIHGLERRAERLLGARQVARLERVALFPEQAVRDAQGQRTIGRGERARKLARVGHHLLRLPCEVHRLLHLRRRFPTCAAVGHPERERDARGRERQVLIAAELFQQIETQSIAAPGERLRCGRCRLARSVRRTVACCE
jgi:hypothetical protein